MGIRGHWLVLLLTACTPTTPKMWFLNWMETDGEEAYAPFESSRDARLTTTTVRLRVSSLDDPWVLEERVRVVDEVAGRTLDDTFTVWPARIRGSQEAPTVELTTEDDEPLDHTDGRCVRAEWPEYDAEPDLYAIFWCEGLYAERTIWLGLGG